MRAAVLYAPKDLRTHRAGRGAPPWRDVEVRIEAGGICGSDLHYYFDGGFGTVAGEPMIWAMRSPAHRARRRRGRNVKPGQARRGQSKPACEVPLLPRGQTAALPHMRFYGSACASTCRAASARCWCATPTQAVPCPPRCRPRRRPSPSRSRSACMRSTAPAPCSANACSSPAQARSAHGASRPGALGAQSSQTDGRCPLAAAQWVGPKHQCR